MNHPSAFHPVLSIYPPNDPTLLAAVRQPGAGSVASSRAATVALIEVLGVLSQWSTAEVAAAVEQAAADQHIDAILLGIDSPGGSVAGIDDAANAIMMADLRKPTSAYIRGMGCSAAYWLAS